MVGGVASRVDIQGAVDAARREALAGDGPYVELMATYDALGELLESGRSEPEFALDCDDLVRRLVKLGVWVERHSEQQWALWMARNTTFGGEREQ